MPAAAWFTVIVAALIIAITAVGLFRVIFHLRAIRATLGRTGRGTTQVGVVQDLPLSGAAARHGRGMITDVSAVLMRDFAANMQGRMERINLGGSPERVPAAAAVPAKGFSLGMRAALMALRRVFGRFFLPYQPAS